MVNLYEEESKISFVAIFVFYGNVCSVEDDN